MKKYHFLKYGELCDANKQWFLIEYLPNKQPYHSPVENKDYPYYRIVKIFYGIRDHDNIGDEKAFVPEYIKFGSDDLQEINDLIILELL